MRAGFDKQVLQAPPRLWDYHLLHFCLLHTLFVHLGQGQLLIKMNNIFFGPIMSTVQGCQKFESTISIQLLCVKNKMGFSVIEIIYIVL